MSIDLVPHIKQLLSAAGLSGNEAPVREILAEAWGPVSDELITTNGGSFIAFQRGTGESPRPKVLIAAHMDAIGLMVTAIEEGFLHFTQVGGVDPRILPGQMVMVHASAQGVQQAREIPGMVVMPPAHQLPADAPSGVLGLNHLLIDTGLEAKEVEKWVRVGDFIHFAQEPLELAGETICGHTLDNRGSVAALSVCLDILSRRKHVWDVYGDATAQEEVFGTGSITDPVLVRPDLAIVIDVTFSKGPGGNGYRSCEIGKGITITSGPQDHPYLVNKLAKLAENLDIPYSIEAVPSPGGTDAYSIQTAESGIPTVEIGLPLRYMHTPVELVSIKDIRRAGRLMAEFIDSLPADFMKEVIWE
ncbi:MAG: M20/M25/M40 family metallo-hydrolase [Anaerolineaceae bacterium]|nr:M20/M25/M40 family metallo-hydrolase [Anaerolineaceae bacterium]